jgi:hypothetical protein
MNQVGVEMVMICSCRLLYRRLSCGTAENAAEQIKRYARDLALAGVGIAYILEPLVRRHIREGQLKWLLPRSALEADGLFLYYPRRASLAPKLRAFIEASKETLARGQG